MSLVALDEGNVEVLRWGERPSLVFLHEGLGSARQWRDFPARVAAATGRGAVAYSRFGYGASDPVTLPRPLDYMQREGEDVLPRLLRAASIDGDLVLVGHSDGASIAIVHAAVNPRISAVVLEAPHVFVEDVSVASIAKAKVAYDSGDLRERLARHHARVDVAFRGWNDAWLDPAFRASFDLTAYLPRIAAPILVIQGEDDPYGTRAQVEAIARGAKHVEVLMLPSCGHTPHREKEEETFDAIVRFLSAGGT